MLTVSELVEFLRNSLDISTSSDKAYLAMSDKDLTLYLKLCASRDYNSDSLEELPSSAKYPLLLLAQIELYKKLAVSTADFIDLGADQNNYIKKSQRFSHYMALAELVQSQYDEYVATGGTTGGVQTYTTRLKSNHMSQRDYEMTPEPEVTVSVTSVLDDRANIMWDVENSSHFGRYKVYIGTSKIVDIYKDGSRAEDKVNEEAVLIKSTVDMLDNTHRIIGLSSNTKYYLAVFSIEKNGVWGVRETTFTTQDEIPEEGDVNIDVLPSESGE